jgi:hypothetical protein
MFTFNLIAISFIVMIGSLNAVVYIEKLNKTRLSVKNKLIIAQAVLWILLISSIYSLFAAISLLTGWNLDGIDELLNGVKENKNSVRRPGTLLLLGVGVFWPFFLTIFSICCIYISSRRLFPNSK